MVNSWLEEVAHGTGFKLHQHIEIAIRPKSFRRGGFQTRPYLGLTEQVLLQRGDTRSLWVFAIQHPLQMIGADIFSYQVQLAFIADDMFVVIALPDRGTVCSAESIDSSCGKSLECTDYLRQRMPLCGGGFQTRPYSSISKDNYAMNMVRHNHKQIQSHIRVMVGNLFPG